MRYIWVGDPHVQKSNLEESVRLFDWVRAEAVSLRAQIMLGGDLYNDFSLVRVEVAVFWHETLSVLNLPLYGAPIVIEGNHDQTQDGAESALTVHGSLCHLMRVPTLQGNVGFVPFIRDSAAFVTACLALYKQGARTIFCHQEFKGSQYENGFYSPHGVDLAELPADLKFISGHIHKQQEFGNVWYPGTPRHLNRSDVGEKKGIWLIDTDDGTRTFLETPEEVCEPFREFVVTPENEDQVKGLPVSSRVYVDVRGPKEFVSRVLKKLPDEARVRTFPVDDLKQSEVSESEGIPKAFLQYMAKYSSAKQLSPELASAVLSRVYAKCPGLRIQ